MSRRFATLLVGLGLAAAPSAAIAAPPPDDLYRGAALFTVRFGGDGVGFGVALRASWTRLDVVVPLGADLEVGYLFDRRALRIVPTAHVIPTDALPTGAGCAPGNALKQRGVDLSIEPSLALSMGPAFELGERFDVGAQLGADVTGAIFALLLRGSWWLGQGPEAGVGMGLTLPSITGQDDSACVEVMLRAGLET